MDPSTGATVEYPALPGTQNGPAPPSTEGNPAGTGAIAAPQAPPNPVATPGGAALPASQAPSNPPTAASSTALTAFQAPPNPPTAAANAALPAAQVPLNPPTAPGGYAIPAASAATYPPPDHSAARGGRVPLEALAPLDELTEEERTVISRNEIERILFGGESEVFGQFALESRAEKIAIYKELSKLVHPDHHQDDEWRAKASRAQQSQWECCFLGLTLLTML